MSYTINMMKTTLQKQIAELETKKINLECEYEICNYAPREVELQIAMSKCEADLKIRRELIIYLEKKGK